MSGRSGWPGSGAFLLGPCVYGPSRGSCPTCRARRSGNGGVSAARQAVIGRVRAALGPQPSVPEVPRDYRRTGDGGVDLFCQRVAEYAAHVHRIAAADLDAAVTRVVDGRTIARPAPDLTPVELDGRVAVTGCALAIAETGTIVLDGGPESGRRALTLVPDHHLCVVRAEQIVASVPEAIAALEPAARAGRPPRPPDHLRLRAERHLRHRARARRGRARAAQARRLRRCAGLARGQPRDESPTGHRVLGAPVAARDPREPPGEREAEAGSLLAVRGMTAHAR